MWYETTNDMGDRERRWTLDEDFAHDAKIRYEFPFIDKILDTDEDHCTRRFTEEYGQNCSHMHVKCKDCRFLELSDNKGECPSWVKPEMIARPGEWEEAELIRRERDEHRYRVFLKSREDELPQHEKPKYRPGYKEFKNYPF